MAKSYESTARVVVMRRLLDEDAAVVLVNKKKRGSFGSLVTRPRDDEIHLQKVDVLYECIRTVAGRYTADYLRAKTHTISVDKSVKEVIINGQSFEFQPESKIKKMIKVRRSSNQIDIQMQEHVFIDQSMEITFDIDGNEIKKPNYKIKQDSVEMHPEQVLEDAKNVKVQSMERADAVSILEERLRGSDESHDISDMTEQFDLQEITEIYVPIYEARVVGPKNKVALIRIDAARKKII